MNDAVGRVVGDTNHDAASWLEGHGAVLRRYFRRRVPETDVDDLVQEVLLKLQANASSTAVESAERYLFTVARNVMVDRHRLQRTHDLADYETYARIGGVADPLSPERIALARDEFLRVKRAIAELPPRARTAFEYHRFEHMTYREIAKAMKISHASVKELVHRALMVLMADLPRSDTLND